jgi:hypothetical protein
VRNFRSTLELPTINTSTASPEIVFLLRHARLETELFYDREYRKNLFSASPFEGKCTKNSSLVNATFSACFSLSITDSEFSYFNFEMNKITSPIYVDASNGMQYHGKILQLKKFQGPITISNNVFDNNNLAI